MSALFFFVFFGPLGSGPSGPSSGVASPIHIPLPSRSVPDFSYSSSEDEFYDADEYYQSSTSPKHCAEWVFWHCTSCDFHCLLWKYCVYGNQHSHCSLLHMKWGKFSLGSLKVQLHNQLQSKIASALELNHLISPSSLFVLVNSSVSSSFPQSLRASYCLDCH